MPLLYCIILKTRQPLVIRRHAQAKSKTETYVFIEEAKKFIQQLKQEMFHLQNNIPNMNTTKFQDAYQEKKISF